MTTRNFHDHPHASAWIIEHETGEKVLISYTTPVIEIDREGWLHVTGLYSMTTIKHIGWFMRELGLTYQLAKQLYNDRKDYNIYTGEVIDND
jgi:hypothetical protein